MRLLRALTLMLLMLHVVPVGAMRADRHYDAHAAQGDAEHCGQTGGNHHEHHESCGGSSAATCCEGASCSSFGTAAALIRGAGVASSIERTPVGPRTRALLRASSPDTPPPKA